MRQSGGGYIDGSAQDCSNSITNALELPQSCAEPSICDLSLILAASADVLQPQCAAFTVVYVFFSTTINIAIEISQNH